MIGQTVRTLHHRHSARSLRPVTAIWIQRPRVHVFTRAYAYFLEDGWGRPNTGICPAGGWSRMVRAGRGHAKTGKSENTDRSDDRNKSDHSGSRKRGCCTCMRSQPAHAITPISIGRTDRAQTPRGSPSCRDQSSSLYPDGFQVWCRDSYRVFHGGDPAFF